MTLAASELKNGEVLVLVLAGHGEEGSGSFKIGDKEILTKKDMEIHVEGTKGTVFLITAACYSGTWASEHWTLLAAAGPDEEGPSIVVSASEKHHGGFSTNVFIAEHTNQY